tara:strand:+ start:67 stop:708 length:642 start_codon:yes stop_codon:yes gene_type:complete
MIQIGTVRFNSDTWGENERWRSENNWDGCVYGLDKQIPDKVPYGSSIYIIEMNNTTNQIMGIGKIKYIFLSENRTRIYNNDNYNRFTYKSEKRIDRKELLQTSQGIIEQIELVLFKGSRHFKRGHGVIIIPHDRFGIIYKKKKRKRVQCAKCGNHGHNARSCKNETREKPPDKPTEKKKCKVCGQLEKGHICTGFQKDENKISNILRFFKGLF